MTNVTSTNYTEDFPGLQILLLTDLSIKVKNYKSDTNNTPSLSCYRIPVFWGQLQRIVTINLEVQTYTLSIICYLLTLTHSIHTQTHKVNICGPRSPMVAHTNLLMHTNTWLIDTPCILISWCMATDMCKLREKFLEYFEFYV